MTNKYVPAALCAAALLDAASSANAAAVSFTAASATSSNGTNVAANAIDTSTTTYWQAGATGATLTLTISGCQKLDDITVNWSTGIGGKGNEGVASYVKQMPNSIGYVELSYALQNKMSYASMQNASGAWVQPNAETFAAAAASADWKNAKDFNLVITNAAGANAWPIAASNFMIMQKQPANPAGRKAALDFFKWALENGQAQAKTLDYVPLPAELVQQVEASWAENFK